MDKKHSENATDYYLILPPKPNDCDALEKFAKDIGSIEGYFPLDETEDLSLRYLKDEFDYVGEDESNE